MIRGITNNAIVVGGRLARDHKRCNPCGAAFANDLRHGGPCAVTGRLSIDGRDI